MHFSTAITLRNKIFCIFASNFKTYQNEKSTIYLYDSLLLRPYYGSRDE